MVDRRLRALRRQRLRLSIGRLGVGGAEVVRQVGQSNLVLWPARAGDGGLDGRKVELDYVVKVGTRTWLAPEPVLLGVALYELERRFRSPCLAEVSKRLVVDREQRRGGAVLGRHIGDRRPISEREARQPVPGE